MLTDTFWLFILLQRRYGSRHSELDYWNCNLMAECMQELWHVNAFHLYLTVHMIIPL